MWHSVHDAPRDRAVWLFLPSAKWTAKPDGTVTDVEHACVVAQWDKAQSAWINRTTGGPVYPSMWHPADIDGAAPEMPKLN